MNYEASLLNKKGPFGIVWLAAHHKSKLNRKEVILLDLEKKCKDIKEYLLNGNTTKPKFNLVISSHLMLGLVTLLNKKYVYLFDDSMNSQTLLNTSYMNYFKVTKNKKPKTPRKVTTADAETITLKENLPTIYQLNQSINSLIADQCNRLDETLARALGAKNLTINESQYEHNNLIQLNYDYSRDYFDIEPGTEQNHFEQMFQIEQNEKTKFDEHETAKKPTRDKSIEQAKTSFSNESTIITEAAEANRQLLEKTTKQNKTIEGLQTIHEDEILKENQIQDQTNFDNNIEFAGMGGGEFINLYQDTLLEGEGGVELTTTMDVPVAAVPAPTTATTEAQAGLIGETTTAPHETRAPATTETVAQTGLKAVEAREETQGQETFEGQETAEGQKIALSSRKLPRSVSLELEQLESKKAKKQKQDEKPKKRTLLIDQNKVLSFDEMRKRTKKTTNRNLFESNKCWFETKYDFRNTDFTKYASCHLLRQPIAPMKPEEMNNIYIKYKFLSKNAISKIQPDDKFSYLVPPPTELAVDQQLAEQQFLDQPTEHPANQISNVESSEIPEGPRERESDAHTKKQEHEKYDSRLSFIQSRKKISTDATKQDEQSIPAMAEYQQLPNDFVENQPPNIDLADSLHQSVAQLNNLSMPEATKLNGPEINGDYKKILLNEIGKINEIGAPLVLQDFIKTAQLPSKCLESVKPRKLFACKTLMASLNLLKENKIKVKQDSFYGDIKLNLAITE